MKATSMIAPILLALSGCSSLAQVESESAVSERPFEGPLGNDYLTITADFDGDGLQDDAYFIQGGDEYLVYIKRGAADAPEQVAAVPASTISKFGLSTFPPGEYEGPCNAEIAANCDPATSLTFVVPHTALALFEYEIGQTMIYWRGDHFISAAPYE